ncbi:MAG: heme o synthase [bacterium]|nr:heme o synthase [bacterium]
MASSRPKIKVIKLYYLLTKPGIVYGNVLTAAAGFLFATRDAVPWGIFIAMLGGLALIIASACVTNNYLDRDIDARMERTKTRALASGAVALENALIFSALLGVLGIAVLVVFTNLFALLTAVFGWLVYILAYTPLKRITPYAVFVGAVAGGVPPVVGYVAAAHTLDAAAVALFIFLFVWQIPHFLAIAVYRFEEYTAAGVPLFMKNAPSVRVRRFARGAFYLSLVVLLGWCLALILQR